MPEYPKLNFPPCEFRYMPATENTRSVKIFDIIRRKFVALTPEEWVRQHLLHFLVNDRKFPQSLLGVEKKLLVNRMSRRTDVVAFSTTLHPILIAECKAPQVPLTQQVFDQAARYNSTLGVFHFIITNGLEIRCCEIDHHSKIYRFLPDVPFYGEIK